MEATLELAAESGISACTFEAISERSGIARSTLYRHWKNSSELVADAIRSQSVERVAADTGTLRDDMLHWMLELGRALEGSTWGAMVPQLVAAASTDPDMEAIQRRNSQYHRSIDIEIIERARQRGEIEKGIDSYHAAVMFTAPIFYRYLVARQPIDARWIASHVDQTVALLRPARDSLGERA
ncbi:MAG: TetR/AcrR family transcriptional regulator [Actinobacteria bacterium]|nr:TetR/AcrR family transcriptional regulator [Actinomycetota bacterium]MBU1866137.1 TetR/AcrR family transcriptional regulator [Actinomycetota bacterium]